MQRVDRHDRETFIAELLKRVPTATRADALRLLRWGRTYGRLAEAECNGDYPYNVEGPDYRAADCPLCESRYRPRGYGDTPRPCPSCRAERIIRETCERFGTLTTQASTGRTIKLPDPWCVPHFQGDPRGHTVRLAIAGQPRDGFDRAALAVPTS
jgi:hypothetical protein